MSHPPPHPQALNRVKWETFAQACARGDSIRAAGEAAGFTDPGWWGGQLMKKPLVRERITAIVAGRAGGRSPDVGGLIDRLIALAENAPGNAADARALDVARGALAEAGKLKQLMPPEPVPVRPPRPAMTLAEWRQKYDPTLPGSEAWFKAQRV